MPQALVATLSPDLWTQLLMFLTWRDTNAMCCVCCVLNRIVNEAKKWHPEWRCSVLGPSVNSVESLKLLQRNYLQWADTRFPPNLVILSAASKDSTPWRKGKYWENAIAAIEKSRLLPRACRIVGVFSMNAVLGSTEEVEMNDKGDEISVTLSISVAHLPETTIEMATFDRKDLRRSQQGDHIENPFLTLKANDSPAFMLFGVNDQSARQLTRILAKWHPTATIIGAVSPLQHCCVPVATYCKVSTVYQKPKARKTYRVKQEKYLTFPSTLLLCLNGSVGIRTSASSGYHVITPVMRCERVRAAQDVSQALTYDTVSVVGAVASNAGSHYRMLDLVEPSERYAIQEEGRPLNIFSSKDSAPLRDLVNSLSSEQTIVPLSAPIHRLEFVLCVQNHIISPPSGLFCWQEGMFGILASHHPVLATHALSKALKCTKSIMSFAHERVIGAFVVAGAVNEVQDTVQAQEIRHICSQVFHGLELSGCISSSSVGPVALPSGHHSPVGNNMLQTHTTCVAIFYLKTRDTR